MEPSPASVACGSVKCLPMAKPVIMVIVSRRELNTLKTIVRERDPHAIVTVADVTEAFGEGFKDISA